MKRIISAILLTSVFSVVVPVAHASTVICWKDKCIDIFDPGVHP
jgi:hypothetical protein